MRYLRWLLRVSGSATLFRLLLQHAWLTTLIGLVPLLGLLVATMGTVSGSAALREGPESPDDPVVTLKGLQDSIDSTDATMRILAEHEVPGPPRAVVRPFPMGPAPTDPGVQGIPDAWRNVQMAEHFYRKYLDAVAERTWAYRKQSITAWIRDFDERGKLLPARSEIREAASRLDIVLGYLIKAQDDVKQVKTLWDSGSVPCRNSDVRVYQQAEKLSTDTLADVKTLWKEYPKYPDVIKYGPDWVRELKQYQLSSRFQDKWEQRQKDWVQEEEQIETKRGDLERRRSKTWEPIPFTLLPRRPGAEQLESLENGLAVQLGDMKKISADQKALLKLIDDLKVQARVFHEEFRDPATKEPPTGVLDQTKHGEFVDKKKEVEDEFTEVEKDYKAWDKRLKNREKTEARWKVYLAAKKSDVAERIQQVSRLRQETPAKDNPTARIPQRLQCDLKNWLQSDKFQEKAKINVPGLKEVKLKNRDGWRFGKFEELARVAEITEYNFFEFQLKTRTFAEEFRLLKSFQFVVSPDGDQALFPREILSEGLVVRYNDALNLATTGYDELRAWKVFADVCGDVDRRLKAYVADLGVAENQQNKGLSFEVEAGESRALLAAWKTIEMLFKPGVSPAGCLER